MEWCSGSGEVWTSSSSEDEEGDRRHRFGHGSLEVELVKLEIDSTEFEDVDLDGGTLIGALRVHRSLPDSPVILRELRWQQWWRRSVGNVVAFA